jgi:protein TonB
LTIPPAPAALDATPIVQELKRLALTDAEPVLGDAPAPVAAPDVAESAIGVGDFVYGLDDVDRGPVRVVYVRPLFPPSARRLGLSGWVQLEFVVTARGNVEAVTVAASEGGKRFEEPARRAVAQWVFRPARLAGRPVPVRCTVRIRFRLEE